MTTIAFLQSGGGAGAFLVQAAPILVIVAIFYFFVIAPANKQRRKTEAMLAALKRGDRVLTTGGIYGTVQGVEGDVIHLKIAENVKVKIARAAVASVVNEAE